MNRSENTGLPPTWEQGQGPKKAQLQEPYHFNSDELRVLRECNRQSFYQRSLPCASLMGIGAYYAVKSGYLRGSARWGPAPKVGLAVILGYFVGKFSYQKVCAEKIMALPNSPLGEMLRKRRQQQGGASFTETLGIESGLNVPSVSDSFEVYSEHGPRSMDLDTTRPMQENTQYTDARPDLDTDVFHEEPLPPVQHTTTYDALRQQNRDDYDKRKSNIPTRGGFSGPLEDSPPVIRARTPTAAPAGDQNQYGDTWVK